MRKVTTRAVLALLGGRKFQGKNTKVVHESGVSSLKLFGHTIAELNSRGELSITTAEWDTRTTRERLNGLPGVHVYTHKGDTYLNGQPWNGRWIVVSAGVLRAAS